MKRDNLRSAAPSNIKLSGDSNTRSNTFDEGAWPQAPSDNEAANPVCNIDQPVDDFDFRRALKQYGRVKFPSVHCPLPHILESERGEGAPISCESKLVTGINPHLRPSAKLQRRAVSVASDSGIPANDNEPDWREAEAA